MEKVRMWLKNFYATYSEETKVTASVLGMTAVSLDLFLFFSAYNSATIAAASTCALLITAIILSILSAIREEEKANKNNFYRGVTMGSAFAFFPYALIFAVPQIIAWQAWVMAYIIWLIVGLGVFALGLDILQGWIDKDYCNGPWAYQLALSSFIISCGILDKIAHSNSVIIWYACFAASLVNGRFTVWKAIMVKTPSGKNRLSDKTFLALFSLWILAIYSMDKIGGDGYTLAHAFAAYILWPVVMFLFWLIWRYSGWKKSPAT